VSHYDYLSETGPRRRRVRPHGTSKVQSGPFGPDCRVCCCTADLRSRLAASGPDGTLVRRPPAAFTLPPNSSGPARPRSADAPSGKLRKSLHLAAAEG
jgi:hypothetical protein